MEEILREKLGRFPVCESPGVCSGHLSVGHLFRLPHAWSGRRTKLADRRRGGRHGDPMTSNGVTAALRHASEASRLIVESRHRTNPLPGSAMYSRRPSAWRSSLIVESRE